MARLPDSELLHIIENPADIDPDAVTAAKAEWQLRGLDEHNLEDIRQRRQAVESMRQKYAVSLPNSISNDWAKFTAWVNQQHANRQLLIWVCIVLLGITTYTSISSIRYSYPAFIAYDALDLYIIYLAITSIGSIVLSYLSIIYLIKLKKWAYWLITFSLALSFSRDILMLPFDAYEKWLVTFDPHYPLSSHMNIETASLSLFSGLSIILYLLLMYLLTLNNIREMYGVSLITLKKLLLAGAILGVAAGAMDIYNWWTWTPFFDWF